MEISAETPLAPYTTLGIGGPAAFFADVRDEEELKAALAQARERGLPLRVLGGGSNLLVPDEGVRAFVVKLAANTIARDGETIVADAGARWDDVVDFAAREGLWGIENLAGIPGTVGGAVVQNIGAYGAALSQVLAYVDVLDAETLVSRRLLREECAFGYRDSIFKHESRFIILRAALALHLAQGGEANLSYRDPTRKYGDLERVFAERPSPSPTEVVEAIRRIRSEKFPDLAQEGTAGSFFANPIVSKDQAEELVRRFPGLPVFALPETANVKIPLGWLLDHVFNVRGLAQGDARVFEKHALVLVARGGARFADVDTLANEIAKRVKDETGITLTREVETFDA